MKKLPVILSFLATSLMGSSFTNSMEEKPTGGVAIGMPSQKFSEFRADFEAMPQRDMSSSPLSHPSSSPVGRSEFYKEVLKVGTRHQHAAVLSEQDEFDRMIEKSRREAEFEEATREVLEASEKLAFANLEKQEIARLEDQIETLRALQDYQSKNRSTLHESLIATISKKYAHGATDSDETRALAVVEYDRIDKELNDSRAQDTVLSDQLSDLRLKLIELKYGRRLQIPEAFPVALSIHLPLGIGGPEGLVANGLPPIHSSSLVTSSAVPTHNSTGDKF